MKILVIAAHPDDEVIGVGGTIRNHSRNGDDVYVAILSEGCSVQYPDNKRIIKQKRDEARSAGKILGVKELFFFDFPETQLDTSPHYKLNQALERVIKKIQPRIVYTHSEDDLHKDHIAIFESSLVACRNLQSPYKIYSYEIASSTEKYPKFNPNHFVDINLSMEEKLDAMKQYKSEIREYPNPRSLEGLMAQARYRGLSIQVKFAEAFKLIKSAQ